MLKEKITIFDNVYIILLFLLAVINADPRVLVSGLERPMYFSLLFAVIICSFFRLGKKQYIKTEHLLRMVFVILMFIFPYIFGVGVYGNRYLHLSGLILYFIIYELESKREIFKRVTVLLIMWSLIVAIPTIIVTMRYPYASRIADYSQTVRVSEYIRFYNVDS